MTLTPDPHGQAALMLCESLMFLLLDKGIVQKDEVADAIEAVVQVKQEIAGTNESVVVSMTSIGLLRAVALSMLAADIPALQPPPGSEGA